MATASHTRRPWRIGKSFRRNGNLVLPIVWDVPLEAGQHDGQRLVCWLFRNALPREQFLPNARLIAGAPDLHEALAALDAAIADFLAAGARSRQRAAALAALIQAREAARVALLAVERGAAAE